VNLADKIYKITFSKFSVKSFLSKPGNDHHSLATTGLSNTQTCAHQIIHFKPAWKTSTKRNKKWLDVQTAFFAHCSVTARTKLLLANTLISESNLISQPLL